jgi:hypothetical protein
MAPNSVVVHPLVLLSVVDHYNRVAKVRVACSVWRVACVDLPCSGPAAVCRQA